MNSSPQDAHRRAKPRLNLGIEAKFIGFGPPLDILLQDISATGAKLYLNQPEKLKQGFLCWDAYEVFGDIVWQEHEWCGMQFERPVSPECLFATRQAAPTLMKAARNATRDHAADFVAGRGY